MHPEAPDHPLSGRERLALAVALAIFLGLLLILVQGCSLQGCDNLDPSLAQAHGHKHKDPAGDSFLPSPAASYVYQQQLKIIRQMVNDYKVSVHVIWTPCGEENSTYFGITNTIVLCTEMSEHPGAAVMFAAHEMGHAITWNLIDVLDENDADEIAQLAMVRHEWWNEMLEGSLYYLQDGMTLGHIPGDVHPNNSFRAWEFACMESGGVEHYPAQCVELYDGIRLKWATRLGLDK